MSEYEFPADEALDDHVPDDEKVVDVTYNGDTEVVETEKVEKPTNDDGSQEDGDGGSSEDGDNEVDKIE